MPATQDSNGAAKAPAAGEAHITVRDLTMAFGSFVLMHDLNFTVQRADVFIIMGGSGCGKSTLLRHLRRCLLRAQHLRHTPPTSDGRTGQRERRSARTETW